MGKVRVCGSRCHNAVTIHCQCWCGGFFHGENRAWHRKNFKEVVKHLPHVIAKGLEAGEIKYKEG